MKATTHAKVPTVWLAESLCLAADWSAFYTAMDRAGNYFMEYMKALLDEANAAHVWLAPGKLKKYDVRKKGGATTVAPPFG